LSGVIALLAAIALAAACICKAFHKKPSTFLQTAKLGKSELTAGEYRLQIDGNKATVQKGKQVCRRIRGRWEDRSAKSAYDSVLLGEGGQVKEVRFAGQARVLSSQRVNEKSVSIPFKGEREAVLVAASLRHSVRGTSDAAGLIAAKTRLTAVFRAAEQAEVLLTNTNSPSRSLTRTNQHAIFP